MDTRNQNSLVQFSLISHPLHHTCDSEQVSFTTVYLLPKGHCINTFTTLIKHFK
jgi:hypothetical protein